MYSLKNKLFLLYFFIAAALVINSNCLEEIINTKDLNEITQCFYQEKSIYAEKQEIIYEIINNNYDKTIFIQFKSIESIIIYQSNLEEKSIIYTKTKDENNFGNYYFSLKNNIEKYYIKIELRQTDLNNYKICFNLFEGKGNSFLTYSDRHQKVSTYIVINSGSFPFYIKEELTSFHALRFNNKYEKYFSFSSFYIKAFLENSDDEISLHINEVFNKGGYKYLIFNLGIEKGKKIKDIVIEVNLNIIEYEENNNKFEIELINKKEIHYEYMLKLKKSENNIMPIEIYYINLKKYVFQQDLDILFYTNNLSNEIFLSNSDNINNENIIDIDKKFVIINKFLLEKEKYKKINPDLLVIIIDENFGFDNDKEIFYHFVLSGSSHHLYKYKEDISKDELFNNDKKILIKSDNCRSSYYINYFKDIDQKKILDYEPIIGNTNLYYSNEDDISDNIDDYLHKLDLFPINNITNSILKEDYGIIKLNCLKETKKILSYIYSYDINSVTDVIYFDNQKALLYIEKDKKYSLKFDQNLREEQFSFRIRILKKDIGDCNVEINYNNNIYNTLNEKNFLELKHEKDNNSIINIILTGFFDIFNQPGSSIILEIIKEIDVEKNFIKLQKTNIENSSLQVNQYLFFEYEQKTSTQSKIILKNEENDDVNICLHKGYGIYPYLIKPICNSNEYINLKKNEEISLIYENPYLSPVSNNINNIDNPLYISLYTEKKIIFSYIYEKYSMFNISNGYKDINFNGKEIVQLENNKNLPVIYYQFYICKDFNNNNIQEYSFTKPIFNYYFDKRKNIEINDINNNIFKEYVLDSNNPNIIFNSDGSLKGKFKYKYGNKNKLKYNENYSKKINIEQNQNILKISVDSPFSGNILLKIIIITSDFEKYNGYCEFIDLYENLKNNIELMYYGQQFIQKELNVEVGSSIVNIEVESEQILDLNRKNAKIFVINNLKEIDFDIFYNPVSIYINLRDKYTELEERNKLVRNIIITIICIIIIYIMFIMYRKFQKRNSKDINYERGKMRLTDGIINESNKLF